MICFNDKHCRKDNPKFCFISDSLLPMSSATSTFQGKLLSNISPLMQKKQESGSVIRWRSTSRMEKYRPPPTTVSPDTSVELAITSLTSSQKNATGVIASIKNSVLGIYSDTLEDLETTSHQNQPILIIHNPVATYRFYSFNLSRRLCQR